jgi:LSD1 subclass zinc finger protein
MQEPPNLHDSTTIITKLEKYISKEYDTITKQDDSTSGQPPMGQHTQYDMTSQNTRQTYLQDERTMNQQQGQYARASHGSAEFMYEDDYEDSMQYTQEQDTRVSLTANVVDMGRVICANCFTPGHYVRDCQSLRCTTCNTNFKTW